MKHSKGRETMKHLKIIALLLIVMSQTFMLQSAYRRAGATATRGYFSRTSGAARSLTTETGAISRTPVSCPNVGRAFGPSSFGSKARTLGTQAREFAGRHRGKLWATGAAAGAAGAVAAGYGIRKGISEKEMEDNVLKLISTTDLSDSEKVDMLKTYIPHFSSFNEETLRELKRLAQVNINSLTNDLNYLESRALGNFRAYLLLTEYTDDPNYEESINNKLNEKKESIEADKKRIKAQLSSWRELKNSVNENLKIKLYPNLYSKKEFQLK